MLLRRLLRRSAAVSGGLRRSLTTAASHPPWAVMGTTASAPAGAPSAGVCLYHPPRVSQLYVPEHLVYTGDFPDPDSDVVQVVGGEVCAASGDGLLLLAFSNLRFVAPILAKQGAERLRQPPIGMDPTHVPAMARFVFNPLTHQLSRLPVPDIARNPELGRHLGLLTQGDRGHGPPDRFAVAELQEGSRMLRFLSEKGKWENVAVSPCQLPPARQMDIDQEALVFRGRLWWVDVTWGAFSADPFSDRPELSFVELPSGSVLPEGAQVEALRRGSLLPDAEGNVWWREAPVRYRRVGVSEGRLRYVEVSQKEPFLLSSFVLDNDGSGWTLERRVALSELRAGGGYPWLHIPEGKTPQIGLLDPLNAHVVYLTVDKEVLVVVDMDRKEVIGRSLYETDVSYIPCVLPPWIGSSQIPSAGKKDAETNKTLSDVLVRSKIP
ncbi:hypothetical protein ACQJBY_002959 [Aegilops geniculata]